MLWVADLVQVFKELSKPLLLEPDIHFQWVVHGGSPNFDPTSGNVGPFMLHFQLLPASVEPMQFRDGKAEGTE